MNVIDNNISQYAHPVSTPYSKGNLTGFKAPNSTIKTSIFNVNDLHGQISKMERLTTAAQCAELNAQQNDSAILKFCMGDTFIGSNYKDNLVCSKFYDVSGIDAATLGNHEFDITASICGDLLKNSKAKILGMNMNFPDNKSALSQKVLRSAVIEDDKGNKYGIIGVQPSDMDSRVKNNDVLEGITIDDKEETIKELQEEVNKLKEQDINKIFLLSHEGNDVEKEIAQSVSGIDVILGGHTHNLIEGVKSGENLFYSPAGEPVIITQAGEDGNNFGILNLEFNDDGQITYAQNNILATNSYTPSLVMSKMADSILGESPVIGNLKYSDNIPKNHLTEENPWADFVSDALRSELDSDIVLINSANFRGDVGIGDVTERDITSMFPFNNKLYKLRLNEKDLVDAIKQCGKSLSSSNSKPGIMQVSGLTYTLDTQGELKDLYYIDKQGNKQQIDINNPDTQKTYTAIYDEFLVGGGDNLDMLKRSDDEIIERYPFDKDKVTIDYIKSLQQPFEVKKDNRIKILNLN